MIATSQLALGVLRSANASSSSRRRRRNTTTKAVKITFVDPEGKIIETNQTKGILRTIALDAGAEVYEGWVGKLMNCGGNGQCGTCSVIVSDPSECLSGTTDAERKKLGKEKLGKGYRLCCQTEIIAGKENENENATIECKTKPPKK